MCCRFGQDEIRCSCSHWGNGINEFPIQDQKTSKFQPLLNINKTRGTQIPMPPQSKSPIGYNTSSRLTPPFPRKTSMPQQQRTFILRTSSSNAAILNLHCGILHAVVNEDCGVWGKVLGSDWWSVKVVFMLN